MERRFYQRSRADRQTKHMAGEIFDIVFPVNVNLPIAARLPHL
jgi:hypothetical protein